MRAETVIRLRRQAEEILTDQQKEDLGEDWRLVKRISGTAKTDALVGARVMDAVSKVRAAMAA